MSTPPQKTNVDQLLKRVSLEYEQLSKQLKLIAKHVEAHRDHLALEGIQEVASQCGVQPSAVVRFAKHFGFSGFSEMQRVFREGLVQQIAPSRNYATRIREVIESGTGAMTPIDIAQEFLTGNVAAMQEMQNALSPAQFKKAVEMLAETEAIWIAGSRRSFPVAVYLDYALQNTEKRIGLVTGLGSMQEGQMRSVRRGDVMLAISFAPYAQETVGVAQEAVQRGARLISITDSRMSPLAREAQVSFVVHDNTTFGFRSLTNTMGLVQSLFIALAYRLELQYRPSAAAGRPLES